MATLIAPHTLLQLTTATAVRGVSDQPVPVWVTTALATTATVVVRRGPQSATQIPVGVRGPQRQQRWAGTVATASIQKQILPIELVASQAWQQLAVSRQQLPAMRALPSLLPLLTAQPWGVGGSVGFELATGQPVAKVTSDLDLIVPALVPMSVGAASDLLHELNQFGVHVDLQVVAGQNGFSLEEYAQQRSTTIMLKTSHGPELVSDPWVALNLETN